MWVDSDPIWDCGLSKRLTTRTLSGFKYVGRIVETLKLVCDISAGCRNMIRLKSEMLVRFTNDSSIMLELC